jgi:hypothetical protein
MRQTMSAAFLKSLAKVGISAGALAIVTKVAAKIPGPIGYVAQGAILVGGIAMPLLRRGK